MSPQPNHSLTPHCTPLLLSYPRFSLQLLITSSFSFFLQPQAFFFIDSPLLPVMPFFFPRNSNIPCNFPLFPVLPLPLPATPHYTTFCCFLSLSWVWLVVGVEGSVGRGPNPASSERVYKKFKVRQQQGTAKRNPNLLTTESESLTSRSA